MSEKGQEERTETGDRSRTQLPRKLGLTSAVCILVGTAIGSGIFRSPAGIADKVSTGDLYLLIWALGGLFALCGALTYAELAGALPHTGGVFVYLREGFGRLPAFLFGWSELVIIRASALGAISTVFAEYLLRLLGIQNADAVHYIAAIAIVVLASVNIIGVNLAAGVQNLMTVIKVGALLLIVAAAFLIGGDGSSQAAVPVDTAPRTASLAGFGLALISVMWVYDGWADLTFVSGEVKRPERNLPLALIIGPLCLIGVYLLANLAYLHLLGVTEIAGSKLVAADAMSRVIGPVGEKLVSVAVMLSAFGTLNGSMMTGSRIFFAMADEGLFFKKIGSVHTRFKTPYVAISLAAAIAVAFVLVRTFEQLADAFVMAIWPFYAGGVAAVYVLRRKRPDLNRPYRAVGYPVTPALFILAALFLLGNALIEDVNYWFGGAAATTTGSGALLVFAIILTGIPAYFLWEFGRRRLSQASDFKS